MLKFDVQMQLEGAREAREKWGQARVAFHQNYNKVVLRLIHEAVANYMSDRDVAEALGISVSRVRQLMTGLGMDGTMRKSKRLLAEHAAKALAENADLLGVHPSEVDLMSPLAYLPMGEEMRQQITDKTTAGVTELPDEDAEFYAEHYADWNVHRLNLVVTVPTKGNEADALELIKEILDAESFDIRVSGNPR
jgi:predicted XRE-type DNA-binding protein